MRCTSPLLKFCGAVAALAVIAPCSSAQGQALAIDLSAFFPPQSERLDAASLAALSGQPAADDFVLGADGVVSSADQLPVPENLVNEIGYDKPVPASSGDLLNSGISNVAECGQSPFSIDQIQQMVTEAAERHDVDISLAVAIAFAESRFDRERNSPAGARGPMQLMPETAARFGVTDACDAATNIDGGVRYLAWLTEKFGNPLLVAAAYNAGEGQVMDYGGVPPIFETVNYVATVVNYQMGIEIEPASDATPTVASASPSSGAPPLSTAPIGGIIQATKPGEFVAGVMEF
jgi:soluble lytic murein transglycosylase-like protein